jgi:hypothetical protein
VAHFLLPSVDYVSHFPPAITPTGM